MNEKPTSATAFEKDLRLVLHPTTAPDDLRVSLLRAARRQDSPWSWRAIGLAATLLILLGGGSWGWLVRWRSLEAERISRAAIQSYMEVQRVDFKVDPTLPNPEEHYSQWSSRAVGFDSRLPVCLTGQSLKGVCACTMASCRAACYRLEDGRAIYVFERPLGGLEDDSGKARTIFAANHRALAWNEGGHGYVLIEPPGWNPVG